ncbi:MAG: hypothetical protein HC840_00310 [Leptolyngbyaceae cyanobacterium RM2_2_4]|nr:hypothetical protein [Leptolyngbyaceae cyanobacterium RM2_2_4]
MTPIELKRLKVELARVQSARMEQELRIDEHNENIERLQAAILVQEAKEAELAQKIKDAESAKT